MISRILVACGPSAEIRRSAGWEHLRLDLSTSAGNVRLRTKDITNKLIHGLEPAWADLVEIATYVYVADQAARRNNVANGLGVGWRREFSFSIPVRCPDFWTQPEVNQSLVQLLGFLSGDSYSFDFRNLKGAPPVQLSLLSERDLGHDDVEEIALFSGGLDSLAGAVQMGGHDGKRMLLVSHRSNSKISKKQSDLAHSLQRRYGEQRFIHVPVWINKDKALSVEFTQRTRTFLFAALAGTMAQILRRNRIHFFENGITSLNLPLSGQLVSTRASRSTHPRVLSMLEQLLTLVSGKTFRVSNSLFWHTKTDIVNLIGDLGCADLISQSVSCHHTWEQTKLKTHCGRCSQCISRRIATLASRFPESDPEVHYNLDLWTDAREQGKDLTLIESTARYGREVLRMSEAEFVSVHSEAISSLMHLSGDRARNLRRIYKLHREHAEDIDRVLDMGFQKHAREARMGLLPRTSLLAISFRNPPVTGVGTQDNGQPATPVGEGLANQFPALPGLNASVDFRTVWVKGRAFTFTATQSACIKFMIQQSREGPATLSQAAILEDADSRSATLKSLFKRSPAWKTLVVQGTKKGTYRLHLDL